MKAVRAVLVAAAVTGIDALTIQGKEHWPHLFTEPAHSFVASPAAAPAAAKVVTTAAPTTTTTTKKKVPLPSHMRQYAGGPVKSSHQLLEDSIHNVIAGFGKCQQGIAKAHSDALDTHGKLSQISRNHVQCRVQEGDMVARETLCVQNRMNLKSKALMVCRAKRTLAKQLASALQPSLVKWDSKKVKFGKYISGIVATTTAMQAQYLTAISACKKGVRRYKAAPKCGNLMLEAKAKKFDCDQLQHALEATSCDSIELLTADLDSYDKCYSKTSAQFDETAKRVEGIQAKLTKRRIEVLRIVCRAGAKTKAQREACDASSFKAQLANEEIQIPAKPGKGTGPVLPARPGTNAFSRGFLALLPKNVDPAACKARCCFKAPQAVPAVTSTAAPVKVAAAAPAAVKAAAPAAVKAAAPAAAVARAPAAAYIFATDMGN